MGFARDYSKIVANFDKLPDGAVIPDKAAAMVLGMHYLTLRKRNPVPQIKVTARLSGRRVGDIRKLTSTSAEAGKPAPTRGQNRRQAIESGGDFYYLPL